MGLGSVALGTLSPSDQAALQQQLNQTTGQPNQTAQPNQTGGATEIPPSPNFTPQTGSTADLEQRAAIAPQQVGQALQANQQPQGQPQTFSQNNPFASMVSDYQARVQASTPSRSPMGGVKGFLTNFFSGMGNSMMHEAGLPTSYQLRQQDIDNLQRSTQLASQWETNNSELKYRQALLEGLQQNQNYQAQLQPLEIQRQNLANQAAQQQLQQSQTTVHPSISAADLQSMGVPASVATQFADRQLTSADMAALHQISASAGAARHPYDYGTDGQGPNKGIWLVDAQFNPIKQLSPVSETGRATALAKLQEQLQLQMGTAGQQGIDIVEGRLDPSQISPRAQNYGMILNAANQYSQQKYGQPFDFAKATGDFKYANNAQTKNTLNYLNSLVGPDGKSGNLQELVNLSNDIGRTQFPALNDVAAWARLEAGSTKMAQYHAAVTEISDQVAKILQGGGSGTSDAKLKQAAELFRTGFNSDQIKGVATTLQGLLANRKNSLIGNNTYLQRLYGAQPNPNATTQQTGAGGFDWSKAPTVQP